MKKYLFIAFISLPYFLNAQNIVYNPSFEEFSTPSPSDICKFSAGHRSFNPLVEHWQTFVDDTPDIFYLSDSTTCDLPQPIDGKAMIGLITYLPAFDRNSMTDYTELVQGKLKIPMQVGKPHYVQFWISHSYLTGDRHLYRVFRNRIYQTQPLASNNIGILFSEHPFDERLYIRNHLRDMEMYPQFNVEEVIETEEGEWKKISTVFTPKSSFQYFLIGNFYDAVDTQTSIGEEATAQIDKQNRLARRAPGNKFNRRIAYYFLDDIYIGIKEPPVKEIKKIANILKKKKTYTFEAVHFESGKYELLPSSFKELDELAHFLKENPSIRVEIGGHTDHIGNAQANLLLSKNRANAVRIYLIEQGVKAAQLTHKGYGERQAIADNTTPEGRQLNRRVECKILN